MPTRFISDDGDHRWRVLLLLMVVVLLPSATVLWLTGVAVRNERAAVREQMSETYRERLELAVSRIDAYWDEVERQVDKLAEAHEGAELFQACVESGIAEGALVFDPQGKLIHPVVAEPVRSRRLNELAWRAAQRMEFVQRQYALASEAYEAIAGVESDLDAEAQAWLAHARCLQKADESDLAADVLSETLGGLRFRDAADMSGRNLWLDAQLRAAQLLTNMAERSDRSESSGDVEGKLAKVRETLRTALDDYRWTIPSTQRLFAMREHRSLFPKAEKFPTAAAESIATEFVNRLDEERAIQTQVMEDSRGVMLAGRPVALLYSKPVTRHVADQFGDWETKATTIRVVSSSSASESEIAMLPIRSMPGRYLSLSLNDPHSVSAASRRQTSLYTMAGLLTIASIAVVAVAIAWFVRREMRLAALKNDLVANVTHELRTPLASTRLLVDTLIENDNADPVQTSDYLRLIAAENERLSRMIDNFLEFSRRQRGSRKVDLNAVEPSELCERAVLASGDKLRSEGCHFETDCPKGLPRVQVDQDAMVMVLVNLLDNAVKFSGPDKSVQMSTREQNGYVVFSVRDNGIGMTATETRKIFDRFYQADTRLSRSHGGSGIGLSLVKSIVDQLGGTIDVDSQVDEGSTFLVRLPAVAETDEIDSDDG